MSLLEIRKLKIRAGSSNFLCEFFFAVPLPKWDFIVVNMFNHTPAEKVVLFYELVSKVPPKNITFKQGFLVNSKFSAQKK